MIFEKACFFSHTATVGRGSCLLYILRLAVNFPAEDMNWPERTMKKREVSISSFAPVS